MKILLQGHRSITDVSDANFTVQRGPPPPNDAFASAILLSGANGTVIGTNVNATNQSGSGEPAGENSVWYNMDPTEQRDCSLQHRHGLADDRRLHRLDDQRPHPRRDVQRQSERGDLDSSGTARLQHDVSPKTHGQRTFVYSGRSKRESTAQTSPPFGWMIGRSGR